MNIDVKMRIYPNNLLHGNLLRSWYSPPKPSLGEDQGAAPTSCHICDPAGQPSFLLGTFLWLQSAYFYPDSNNQILEDFFEESTVFFVSMAYNIFPAALENKTQHMIMHTAD